MKGFNVAVVGVTGMVGQVMVRVLEERKFPVANLKALASENSKGSSVKYNGKNIPVEVLTKDSFKDVHFALFSAGAKVSLEYAPIAAKAGAIVIDNTSAFRMDKDVPLVVPEVNGHVLSGDCRVACAPRNDKGYIIANPNCSTIQLVCVLKPVHDAARIRRVVVSTYQSVSGAGKEAMEQLSTEILGSAQDDRKNALPHQIAYNCIPQIDVFERNGYTKEEMKVVNETKKIMGDDSIAVTCTAVRVPVKIGHSESVNIETEKKLSAEDFRKILNKCPNVAVVDDPSGSKYPLAISAEGKDETFVGRIREDISISNGIECWIVADNLRKGAATNAVQIAELLI